MSFAPGTRLGAYEIIAQIGQGGMGQVFRATDTSLGRLVAIKILPEAFASDPDRLARFEREARTLAALNHPHIAGIYAVEKSPSTVAGQAGVYALVMELVDGEDLAERIARGRIPVDDALTIARQIANALEAAHEQGIVHRDLKPANIRIRPDGTVKVLDFGLAKAVDGGPGGAGRAGGPGGAGRDFDNSPTLTSPAQMTGIGMILGTAAYMAPEQAKGRTVHASADVWAFGAVLFEMLSGRRAFDGDDMTEVLGAVVRLDPDWNALPATVPPRVRQVIVACLRKNVKERIAHIQDARLALDGVFETQATTVAPPRRRAAWPLVLAAAAGAAALAGVTAWMFKPAPASPQPVTRFTMPLPSGQNFVRLANVALSPDGRRLAYMANGQAYIRRLEDAFPVPVRGTEGIGALNVAWSPDGEWLAFSGSDGFIKRLPANGGTPLTVARPSGPVWGLSWTADDTLLYASFDGISRVAAAGGTPERLIDTESSGSVLTGPQRLPDGRTLLFTVEEGAGAASINAVESSIVVQSPGTKDRQVVLKGGFNPHYLASGHLVFTQGNKVMAVPFDPDRRAVRGVPVEVISGVASGRNPWHSGPVASLDFSNTGTLAFAPAFSSPSRDRELVWVDRAGRESPLPIPPGRYIDPRIDPSGKRLALGIEGTNGVNDVWVLDLPDGGRHRITFGSSGARYPLWTPDGTALLSFAFRDGSYNVFRNPADGSRQEERLIADTTRAIVAWSWTGNGDGLATTELAVGSKSGFDVGMLKRAGDQWERTSLLESEAAEAQPVISPSGRWMAYAMSSGIPQIEVRAFPQVNSRHESVTADGGTEPLWSRDGRTLFYRNGNTIMAVAVQDGPVFATESPTVLFRGDYFSDVGRQWDVSPDGTRVLMLKPVVAAGEGPDAGRPQINVIQNWQEELKRLVPIK